MRTSFKVAIAFGASIAIFLALRLILPDQPGIASIPGALFTGYVCKLSYDYFVLNKNRAES